jgi:hypothetical protein
MPVVAVNLSESLFGPIRALVENGVYPSLEEFLAVAAYNQLALERSTQPEELIARGHRQVHDVPEAAAGAAGEAPARDREPPPRRARKRVRRGAGRKPAAKKKLAPAEAVDVGAVLGRWAFPAQANFPATAKAERRSADEHLWGQVNRLFPAKLVCRWVARAGAVGAWPGYEAVVSGLADDAAAVGAVLERWDVAAGRKRDEILSTGLPRRGNSASRDRFLSQYLARVSRAGEVHPGAVCHYALASCDGDQVVLTERGLEFAGLTNPILDGHNAASTATLGEAEAEFLRKQIVEYAPGELRDMRAVLGAVAGGKVTPTDLAAAVRGQFPSDWSAVVFSTHVSGLIARLADLRLLRRRWKGRNVQYSPGDNHQVTAFLG